MLPAERRRRLMELAGDAVQAREQIVTVVDLGLDGLVIAAFDEGADFRLALARAANEAAAKAEAALRLAPAAFAALIVLESSGSLSATQAKQVLAEMLESGGEPKEIAARLGFEALGDDAVATILDEIIASNAPEWARFLDGDEKVTQFFLGQVMRATKGRANGKLVAEELSRRKIS
jgi:aspartyl-tRNA(Asn)/glutamyl-tRNA(Gln) amidotransferase subunit B